MVGEPPLCIGPEGGRVDRLSWRLLRVLMSARGTKRRTDRSAFCPLSGVDRTSGRGSADRPKLT